MIHKKPITSLGMTKIKKDLYHLKSIERPNIISAIAEARSHGDLSENAEYHSAREKQGQIEHKIRQLESIISQSFVMDKKPQNDDIIVFGSTVTIQFIKNKKKKCYTLVSEYESDVDRGLISMDSPLARSMIGKKKNDKAYLEKPNGREEYVILSVKWNISQCLEEKTM